MQEVGDWSQSGTGLLDHRALRLLQSVPATELGHLCARNPEPLMHVTSIGELAMHSADDKAKQFARSLFQANPDMERVLTSYFGQKIMEFLKA